MVFPEHLLFFFVFCFFKKVVFIKYSGISIATLDHVRLVQRYLLYIFLFHLASD